MLLAGIKNVTGVGGRVKKFSSSDAAQHFAQHGSPASLSIVGGGGGDGELVVHTDGSALRRADGTSVAAYGIYFGHNHPCNCGHALRTPPFTNNRAELMAIRGALDLVSEHRHSYFAHAARLTIVTDSSYSRDALGVWRTRWERTNFMGSNGQPIVNRDIIEPLWRLLDSYFIPVTINWTKGHASNDGNVQADRLANATARAMLSHDV